MTAPIVIVGIGELAGPFALGFLRLNHAIYPVLRQTDRGALASEVPGPALTLVTVREADLDEALVGLPAPWRTNVVLVQNDLVPADWERHNLVPTVAVVWFEKKPGAPTRVIRPTVVGGPCADLVVEALGAADIPAVTASDDELLEALVAKNLYIGVSNIAGLATPEGITVGALWSDHRQLAEAVAHDVLSIQEGLLSRSVDREALVSEMVASFEADPEHGATGRSAPQRLDRALVQAAELGLAVDALQRIRDTA